MKEKTEHERMADYYENLREFRAIAKKDHGPRDLIQLDAEIARVRDWLVRPTDKPKEKHHGFHVEPLKNRKYMKLERLVNPKRYFL
jgi:hypothetical protein